MIGEQRVLPRMNHPEQGNQRVVRDASWVEREYGREKWPAILAQIEACLATGETSLSRTIATTERWEFGTPDLQAIPGIAYGKGVRLPASLAYLGLPTLVAETVIAACHSKTGAIIELGCGWGKFLFEVWLRGGPRAARYHALEFTQAGRDCVATLARLEPTMQISVARFDFQYPDLSSIHRSLEHAVVFTVSSIHQVPLIDVEAYRAIFAVAETIDCLHFEQIGWQISPGNATDGDRDYALQNDYNRNLWNVLSGLSEKHEVEFRAVCADIFGSQSQYPLSFVHWQRLNSRRVNSA